ncbi:SH3 domain-containing protein [Phaeobacter marinintestinus]|uniref:SH3 domain-containing protein n=1 Tax=Falsiphaeobacter marinintestinus TaxID=1492905 RepID=UPI0011B3FE12|nr:SH3 domain-containing protein [Phaeobacter marinintestinus]
MRLVGLVLSILLVVSAPLGARDLFPVLHDVSGVAANDVLNVRAAPSSGAPIVGTLAFDQTGVEVLDTDPSGKWGLVNVGEAAGWASLRYLQPRPDPGDYALAQDLQCFGTEPFWTLDLVQGQRATFSRMSEAPKAMPAGLLSTSGNRTDRFVVGLGQDAVLIVSRMACNDGMSDRQFGIEANLVSLAPGLALLTGCCTLALN